MDTEKKYLFILSIIVQRNMRFTERTHEYEINCEPDELIGRIEKIKYFTRNEVEKIEGGDTFDDNVNISVTTRQVMLLS